ncbi:hypothetical protein CASFOL_015881 [Castilleja foliolosa]|uniref:Protein NEOXANTHIN-DEFICIENT 1 n=1 Tax=Castilleja foliolosa TaxID=1961234 RepID=A0ABD3DFC8_9LAMI
MVSGTMETAETNTSLEYGKAPWVFRGSALYQLHVVKAETARAFVPKDFKLVEAFGYTLGGFFLANYEDSPVGKFDELVVIAGTVWNPPTSCAWAAKVLVNSEKAYAHGLNDVGLPSQVATFTKSVMALPGRKRSPFGGFLNKIGMSNSRDNTKSCMNIQVKEMANHIAMGLCSINLTGAGRQCFSGRTEYNPDLLKYSCQIECRLRAVSPAKVFGPSPFASASNMDGETTSENRSPETGDSDHPEDIKRKLCISVMLSKPILALEFNFLKMTVDAPTVVS